MHLHRFVIGILHNEKMFRLPSLGGVAIDDILKLRDEDKKIKSDFFTKVSMPSTKDNEYSISLVDDSGENKLNILTDQFIYKKTAINDKSAVNIDKAISEFQILWKTANKALSFPSTRRIGFVAEFRLNEEMKGEAGKQLVAALTKFDKPDSCSRFHLTFEERKLTKEGKTPNKDTDDFQNTIFTFYISDLDETPQDGMMNANIDFQRYFNPAKLDTLKELMPLKKQFIEEKTRFKNKIKELGLS